MLCIFDIDGTICDSRSAEGVAFSQAIEEITGTGLATIDWSQYKEPTSSSIVRKLLSGYSDSEKKEGQIKRRFIHLLLESRKENPEEFYPVTGVVEFIKSLCKSGVHFVSIATGCWDFEARFKLQCCGLDLDEFPHATSSDTPVRGEIIKLSASRGEYSLDSCLYFGDGQWDVTSTQKIGIQMIGIGRKFEKLKEMGVEPVFRDFSDQEAIMSAVSKYQKKLNL